MFAGGAAASLVALGYRYRRIVTPTERQQIHWVVLGITVALAGTLATVVADLIAGTAALTIVALDLVRTMAVLAIPVSIAIAILRHRLWGVDVVINRALVYASLTAGIFSLYVLIVGTLGWALRSEDNLFVSIVATAAVALLFAPLRDRLERGVNHLMYGHRDDPFTVVTRLGERLDATLAPDAMLPAVVSSVREALQLPYVEIVGAAGVGGSAIASGEPVNGIERIPLSYLHEEVGVLLVGRRRGESSFSAADRALLTDLARQAGTAMHMVRITAELQRSRERLVTAREEERRRLRRDLHDGLGAQMAALKVQSRVLRGLIHRDPEAAEVEATALHAELQEAIIDVRRLVHDLRPPALDDLGLVGALRRLAQQHDRSGLTVVVIAPEESIFLPAAVEVALYRVAQEALVNVARHADARHCEVRLTIHDRDARLCITDDGRGLP
jgi:signal transduction histidine kinase